MSHHHHHEHDDLTPEEARERFERDYWESAYSEEERRWSGNPNAQLVAEASDLPVGTAIDVGCGEGGDVVWLAKQGWKVTALDFAQAALDRTREHAEQAGVADHVDYERGDLRDWSARGRTWDLVSSQFVHEPDGGMVPVVKALAAAVAPGGTLLVVGHDPSDHEHGGPALAEARFSAEEIVSALDPAEWSSIVAETRRRVASRHLGHENVAMVDAVLVARKR